MDTTSPPGEARHPSITAGHTAEGGKGAREQLLRIGEVAKWTGIPEATLRYFRSVGDRGPKSAKLGRRVVYRESDVQAWIDAQFAADSK